MAGQVLTQTTKPRYTAAQNLAILAVALLIDFTDAIPVDLLFLLGLVPVPVGIEAGVSLVEAAFLNHLGVPVVKVLAMSGADMLPFAELVPWCTLAVLDTRFEIRIPLVTRMFNY